MWLRYSLDPGGRVESGDKPADGSKAHPVFTVIPGDGPAPKEHLSRDSDGFVCLNLAYPRRARLRLVDASYEPDPIPEDSAEYPRF